MKKIIIMLSIFAVMLSFAAIDLWYTSTYYARALDYLMAADESIQANKEHLDNPETIRLCDEANEMWERGKRNLMMLVNHNVVRYVDEKFVGLLEQVRCNNKDDACVTVKVLISYIKDLREENYPLPRNII